MAQLSFYKHFALASVTLFFPVVALSSGSVAQANAAPAQPNSLARQQVLVAFEPLIDSPKSSRGGGRRLFEPPPGQDGPASTRGGGRRNENVCSQDRSKARQQTKSLNETITPILPPKNWGLTASDRPTFLVYVPRTSAKAMEFTLENPTGEAYQMTVPLPPTPGVVRLSLPKNAPSLEVGKDYAWRVAFACKADVPGPEDPFIESFVRRVAPSEAPVATQNQTITLEGVKQLAKAGLWYDASAGLANLKHTSANDPSLQAAWNDLLSDVGMEALATVPVN